MTDNTTPARLAYTSTFFPVRDSYNERPVDLTTTSGATGVSVSVRPARMMSSTTASMTPDEARELAADLIARADEIDERAAEMTAARDLLDRVEADNRKSVEAVTCFVCGVLADIHTERGDHNFWSVTDAAAHHASEPSGGALPSMTAAETLDPREAR